MLIVNVFRQTDSFLIRVVTWKVSYGVLEQLFTLINVFTIGIHVSGIWADVYRRRPFPSACWVNILCFQLPWEAIVGRVYGQI